MAASARLQGWRGDRSGALGAGQGRHMAAGPPLHADDTPEQQGGTKGGAVVCGARGGGGCGRGDPVDGGGADEFQQPYGTPFRVAGVLPE